MERKKKKRLIIAMIGTMLMCSQVLAFDLMGPTTSRLKDSGDSSIALEYFWSSMEISADSIPELGLTSDTIKDVDLNKISTNFALGLGRGSELFLRLGVAEADPDKGDNQVNVAGYVGSSDECFFIGGGAKWTLYDDANFRWGLLTQVSWADYDYEKKSYSINGHSVDFSTDIEIVEVQIATGPTFQLNENVEVYGGPFLYFLNGDADLNGSIDGSPGSINTDLEEESLLGGYIGAELGLSQNAIISFEVQVTSDSVGMGGQLVWKF